MDHLQETESTVTEPGKSKKQKSPKPDAFTAYEKTVIFLVALVQFTIVLDFMVMAPLGDIMMKQMSLTPSQFASAVSVYAFAAGIAGILAAGFADKYDRKKQLIVFYSGFILGTLLCGVATSYPILLTGRLLTGLFAGILGSVAMAIIADLFPYQQRGRVMGFVQSSFGVSQVAGLPLSLYLANQFNWQAPFILVVIIGVLTSLFIVRSIKPINANINKETLALVHLQKTVANRNYWLPFLTTALLTIGTFMLMPFSTPFMINNLGISQTDLPLIYVITGVCAMVILPIVGKVSDRVGKFPVFVFGTIVSIIMLTIYVNLPRVPLWQVILVNSVMFVGILSRMIPATALMTVIPQPKDRGSFMSINSSLQQMAGGIASIFAGWVIWQQADGTIRRFDTLSYLALCIMVTCAFMMFVLNKRVQRKLANERS